MHRAVRRLVLPLVAAVALAGCGDRDSRIAYKELLSDDPQVRADAAARLGQARAADAVDSLVAVLDDPDESVRVTAIRSLAQIGDRKAVPALAPMAEDPLPSVRLALCQALGQFQDPAGGEALRKLLYDDDETIRLGAARALGKLEGPEGVKTLIEVALRDESESVRQHVLKVLAERRVRESVPQVEAALAGEADIVRANAAQALIAIGDRSSVPVLVRALDDPNYKVRALASHALGTIAPADAEVAGALRKRLAAEDHPLVQVDLAWNLARGGDRSEVPRLRELLFKGSPEDVRAEAAIALGEVGDKTDIALLNRAMDDKKGLVRKQAFLAVEKLEKK
jgi:HEAT repeat protein